VEFGSTFKNLGREGRCHNETRRVSSKKAHFIGIRIFSKFVRFVTILYLSLDLVCSRLNLTVAKVIYCKYHTPQSVVILAFR
jgi:hypothetical protein